MCVCVFVPVFCCEELTDLKEREGKLAAQLEEKEQEQISNGLNFFYAFNSIQFNSSYIFIDTIQFYFV